MLARDEYAVPRGARAPVQVDALCWRLRRFKNYERRNFLSKTQQRAEETFVQGQVPPQLARRPSSARRARPTHTWAWVAPGAPEKARTPAGWSLLRDPPKRRRPTPSQLGGMASQWKDVLQDAKLQGSNQLGNLELLDVDELVAQIIDRADRVGALAALKAAGVSKLAERQAIACALQRRRKLAAAVAATRSVDVRERIPLIVSINVHELPTFILHQLAHIRLQLPCAHRIVLNCNDEMFAALRAHLPPEAYSYENSSSSVSAEGSVYSAVVVHPQPLNKKRFHGSLLEGIMRNMEFALRRFEFEQFLVLSSRSWFRRPLTLEELRTAVAPAVPSGGIRRATLEYVKKQREDHEAEHGAWNEMRFVDVSGQSPCLEVGMTSNGQLALSGSDWGPLLRTKLANELLPPPHTIVKGPHEGLLLEHAACEAAAAVLDSRAGRETFLAEAEVEEIALQSIAHSRGLRFAQLSDMGPRHGIDESQLAATGAHVPPLTKTERVDLTASEGAHQNQL